MPTEKQILANRLNSQKSTGPRTEAGKSISRMNALQSGLHAASLIIRGEDAAALTQLAAEYNAEFHPVTPRQRDLVDTLVRNEWKIRRLERLEAELWEAEFDYDDNRSFDPDNSDHLRRQLLPLRSAFLDIETRLERLQRRLHAYERSSQCALKELRGVGLLACQPAEGRQHLETETTSPEIGFVPSTSEDRATATLMPSSPPPEPPIGFVPSAPAASIPTHPTPAPGPREQSEPHPRVAFAPDTD